ncbi:MULTISPECIES: DUF5357 family protein [unclassified Leptolyngbya]|uniref:DUF5357 family protein n=1 Tax=unclassified Leptolyngbya TaxID=2650499 RepID=UPI00168773F2|nr:DUF5357 family protein [Leptolyngbya sp. FACHB-8]MBD2154541.1 DUF5357 family protein [Leptolyngbya sp. FACHB-16]
MKELRAAFEALWKQLKPPQAYSWQTLIWLSVFAWLLSILTVTEVVEEILSWLGWLFLTIGVGWASWGIKLNFFGWMFRPGPWFTGALACTLLFWREGADPFPLAVTLWPVVSAAIAIVPRFFPRLTFTLPDPITRQDMLVLLLVSLVMSCWFRFHFLVQDWLTAYPSLLADDFSNSGFVVSISDELPAEDEQGTLLLGTVATSVEQQLDGRPWRDAERWLFERDQRIVDLQQQALNRLQAAGEGQFWNFQALVPPQTRPDEYTLLLRARWLGPSSRLGGYYLEKTCWVRQVNNPVLLQPGGSGSEPVTEVQCAPGVSEKKWLVPETTATGGLG